MKMRHIIGPLAISIACLSSSGPAYADGGAQAFLQRIQGKLASLLQQAPSQARDTQITHELDALVDFDELARRTFGEPCPAAIPSCKNHWSELTPAQQTEITGLLKRLVQKNYQKNLVKTLDYEITFQSARAAGQEERVRTEAKSKLRPRDPPLEIDYVVRSNGANRRVVDIVTEGSSLTKNYYDQFHKMLLNQDQGYSYIVKKLNDKLAKRD